MNPAGLIHRWLMPARATRAALHGAIVLVIMLSAAVPGTVLAAPPGSWVQTATPILGPGQGTPTSFQIPVPGPRVPTVLPNGTVMALISTAGGSKAELYNPATNTWSMTGAPVTGSNIMTDLGNGTLVLEEATALLHTGQVLWVAGGSAQLYDPVAGTWKMTGSPIFAPAVSGTADNATAPALIPLPDGDIMAMNNTSVELYRPATGTWSTTADVPLSSSSLAMLPSGRVLASGGCCNNFTEVHADALTGAALYDPVSRTWMPTGSMRAGRYGHTATLLASGKVLITGGLNGIGAGCCPGRPVFSNELYDPKTGTWSPTGSLPQLNFVGQMHSSTLLSDGDVLVLDPLDESTSWLYHPTLGTWTAGSTQALPGLGLAAASLRNGPVLVPGDPSRVYTPLAAPLPPTCQLSAAGVDGGGHAYIKVAARDIASGLRSVQVIQAINSNISLPKFAQGSRDPAVVTATKVNATQPSSLSLRVTNMAGQTLTCDPVVADIVSSPGVAPTEVFRDLSPTESTLTISNGRPGLERVDVIVNGRHFGMQQLRDGETRSIDVAPAMRPDTNNWVRVVAHGRPGSRAVVVIADS